MKKLTIIQGGNEVKKILIVISVLICTSLIASCSSAGIPSAGVFYCEKEGLYLDFYSFSDGNRSIGKAWRNKNGIDEELQFTVHTETNGIEVKDAYGSIFIEYYGALYQTSDGFVKYGHHGNNHYTRNFYKRIFSPQDLSAFPDEVKSVFPNTVISLPCIQNYYISDNEIILDSFMTPEIFMQEIERLKNIDGLQYIIHGDGAYDFPYDGFFWHQNAFNYHPEKGIFWFRSKPYVEFDLYMGVIVKEEENELIYIYLRNVTDTSSHLDGSLMPIRIDSLVSG